MGLLRKRNLTSGSLTTAPIRKLTRLAVTTHKRHKRLQPLAINPFPIAMTSAYSPLFRVGDSVQTKNIHPAGHTRLPRYVRGKRCVIVNYYGVQNFGDGLPGEKAAPQPLYNVRFTAQELWGNRCRSQ